nr:cystatin-C-like [Cavia porcellus]
MTPMASKSSKKWLRLMGKLEKGDIFNEEIQKAVEFAMQEHNKDSTDQNLFRVTRVVRVQEQVVTGMNYHLDLEIGRTTCVKNTSNQINCPLSKEPTQLCSFLVYFRARNKYVILKKSKCYRA